MTSTSDDDLINLEENGELKYRKQQLKKLQEEVADIEGMIIGISIMELGLNERNRIHPFYMVYIRTDGDIICDYLELKSILDNLRLLCRGKKEPISPCC